MADKEKGQTLSGQGKESAANPSNHSANEKKTPRYKIVEAISPMHQKLMIWVTPCVLGEGMEAGSCNATHEHRKPCQDHRIE